MRVEPYIQGRQEAGGVDAREEAVRGSHRCSSMPASLSSGRSSLGYGYQHRPRSVLRAERAGLPADNERPRKTVDQGTQRSWFKFAGHWHWQWQARHKSNPEARAHPRHVALIFASFAAPSLLSALLSALLTLFVASKPYSYSHPARSMMVYNPPWFRLSEPTASCLPGCRLSSYVGIHRPPPVCVYSTS